MSENIEVVLRERPTDNFVVGKTFENKKTPLPKSADLQDGQILVESLYLSLDPAMRGWVSDKRSYLPPVKIGERMRGYTIARVLASKSKQAAQGDIVLAHCGWTQYAIIPDGGFEPAASFPKLNEPSDMLSLYGLTGLTAWVGMAHLGEPKPNDTVVVSGAAGATGSFAGQIAKAKGARVVGICGSDDKCKWLREDLGFDAAINYKAADFKEQLNKATPDFIDVYYDNVGGEILDLCLGRAKKFARFIECGMISTYNSSEPVTMRNIANIVTMSIKLQGFIVMDHQDHYAQARKELGQWAAEGKIKKKETIVKGGIEIAEHALVDLFKGSNTGKLLVEVKDPRAGPAKL